MNRERRRFLTRSGAAALISLSGPRLAFAKLRGTDRRFVFVLLRGGLDGLSAVPAFGDPDYHAARRDLALPAPGTEGGVFDLDGFFGLHPALPHLAGRWRAGELLVVHAQCPPYRGRSHFDAQNVLEHGGTRPYELDSGWLNRALNEVDRGAGGVAIASAMPLALRGSAEVTSWSPSRLPAPDAALLDRVARLYRDDAVLADAFRRARRANTVAGDDATAARAGDLGPLMRAAARFLSAPEGPRVAMLEAGGWDSHSAQERPLAGLGRRYRALDDGLELLATELGEVWRHTVVVVMSEFGRTVAMNGSGGTDHGTGGAAFVLGGAVAGGRVVADWPGLRVRDRFEGRDLRATLDSRALLKGVLAEHLGIRTEALASRVFPGSARISPIGDLIG